MIVSAKTRKVQKYGATFYQGYAEAKRNGKYAWSETSPITRVNRDDALNDSNNIVLSHEGMTLNASKVTWKYAKIA